MILVNQKHQVAWHKGITIRDVLKIMNYTYPHMAVRVNGTPVLDDQYDTYTIPDEADVRVIHLIAGG
ncbi:MAG: sulfur carrier protein ThiS [Anaerolineae bacterium]|nr:sulfur carrier protein ThiS [Anaerolineae bacterium]